MSLTVTPELVTAANAGRMTDEEFVACIRASLPYAYHLVEGLVAELPSGGSGDLAGEGLPVGTRPAPAVAFVDNQVPPPDEAARGQLLRAMASTSIRTALERHFGVALAFQNCHRVAVFPPAAVGSEQYRAFVSSRAQILNQQPEFLDC
ncbi:SCO5389 family protein [Parafrankia elaeagni]|uniref:SCO5389 family protein n=1 Tax=Parafrankia elaeagni TaxID=222534 RepID=UPI00037D23B0|nr:SCO5389 family protein [Parafrankia elaeagni]